MTVNHFLITRGGLTRDGALYAPLVQGSGPVTRDVTDNRQAIRMNRFTDPKLAASAGGWALMNAAWSAPAGLTWDAGRRVERLCGTAVILNGLRLRQVRSSASVDYFRFAAISFANCTSWAIGIVPLSVGSPFTAGGGPSTRRPNSS